MSNVIKIRPVGAELFHADRWTDGRTDGQTDRQTDMMKLIVAFCNFANEPENCERMMLIRDANIYFNKQGLQDDLVPNCSK